MKFIYTAKNSNGQIQNGSLEVPNETAAAKTLQAQGLYLLDLKQEGESKISPKGEIKIPFLSDRVGLKDKIIFTQQLSMMIRSGLPLIDAFRALQEQTENKYFAQVLGDITEKVRGGKTLSLAMAEYPNIFSKLYISIVKSGEKSGKLDEVLNRLADELEKDYDLITKIKGAVTYPILIIIALIGIVILMLIFVIPQIKKIFIDMGVELPLVTRIILGTSDIIRNYWYIVLAVLIALVLGIRFFIKTPRGKFFWDSLKIKIPLIGKIVKKVYMARFARTTGMLVASGLPILDIIKTMGDVINNEVYKQAMGRIGKGIESGKTFSDALKKEMIFPPMIYHLIFVGEKSGKMDEVLLSMANFFDKEVETATANLANLVEPILIIIVGAGVGLVVAAVIMPIYSLVNVI